MSPQARAASALMASLGKRLRAQAGPVSDVVPGAAPIQGAAASEHVVADMAWALHMQSVVEVIVWMSWVRLLQLLQLLVVWSLPYNQWQLRAKPVALRRQGGTSISPLLSLVLVWPVAVAGARALTWPGLLQGRVRSPEGTTGPHPQSSTNWCHRVGHLFWI